MGLQLKIALQGDLRGYAERQKAAARRDERGAAVRCGRQARSAPSFPSRTTSATPERRARTFVVATSRCDTSRCDTSRLRCEPIDASRRDDGRRPGRDRSRRSSAMSTTFVRGSCPRPHWSWQATSSGNYFGYVAAWPQMRAPPCLRHIRTRRYTVSGKGLPFVSGKSQTTASPRT